jgi:hypothetical protein
MSILKYVKSNIYVVGMVLGIVLISSLFFVPLQEHW